MTHSNMNNYDTKLYLIKYINVIITELTQYRVRQLISSTLGTPSRSVPTLRYDSLKTMKLDD